MEKLRSVQALRAVAAISVVVCHAAGAPLGAAGVDIFFVTSGFVIAGAARGRSASEFIFARVWRVYPPYLIAMVPFVGLDYARLATSFTLWPVWDGEIAAHYLPPAWTLSFEMLFYSAMAVVIATKRHRLIVVGFVAALVGGLIWPTPLLRFVGNPIILEFLMGVALFRLQQVPAIGTAAIFVALMLFAVSPATGADNNLLARTDAQIVFGKWDGFIRLGFWGLPAALLVYGAVSNEQWFRRSSWKPMVWLGGASYSIYLLHWWPTHSGLGPWPILVGMSLLAGGMFHLAIERPLLSFKLAPFKHRRLPSGDPDQLHDQAVYESQ